MNNLSPEKSATGHDYDNVSIGKCKLNCVQRNHLQHRDLLSVTKVAKFVQMKKLCFLSMCNTQNFQI